MDRLNHNQFKNAVAFLAEKLHRESPDNHYILAGAKFRPRFAQWELEVIVPIPENTIMDITRKPPILVSMEELADEENTSLEGLFIEINRADEAIEIADEFILTNRQVMQASLVDAINLSTKTYTIWHLSYDCRDLEENPFFYIIKVDIQTASILSSEIFRPKSAKL